MKKRLLIIISIAAVFCMTVFGKILIKHNLSKKAEEKPKVKVVQKQSPYKKYGYKIDTTLSRYKNALKNTSSRKVKIYCIGESSTRGEYSSDEVNKSWVGILKSSMQNKYGNAGEGFISIYEGELNSGTKPRWRLGSGWTVSGALNTVTNNVGGFGGCFGVCSKSGLPATLSFTGTNLDLLYAKSVKGGKAKVTIDGSEVGTLNCFGETLSFSNKVSYSGLSNSHHTLIITPNTSSRIYIEGAIASSSAKGIEVDKIAISSKAAGYFNSPLQKKNWNTMPEPDLVLLSFGLNEASNHISAEAYKANMEGLVKYWQERGSSVCLVTHPKPAESWTKNWPSYIKSVYEVADTYNVGIIDIYKAYFEDYTTAQKQGLFGMAKNDYSGGSGTNTGHPSDKGYKYIGDIIYANLE